MSEITALYLHGLGRTELRPGERAILARHRRLGIAVVPVAIDWCSAETFPELLDRVTHQATDLLVAAGGLEKLLIEGSSAGGSLAINVARQLNDPRVQVISHSGRLRAGDFARGSRSSLEQCAHLGTNRASQSFYDSVQYCETVTLPSLTKDDKGRMTITKPLADEVVPINTMTIDGVRTITVPIIGHSLGIGWGMLKAPSLIR